MTSMPQGPVGTLIMGNNGTISQDSLCARSGLICTVGVDENGNFIPCSSFGNRNQNNGGYCVAPTHGGDDGSKSGNDYCALSYGAATNKNLVCVGGVNVKTNTYVGCANTNTKGSGNSYSYYCVAPNNPNDNGSVSGSTYCAGNWNSTNGQNKGMACVGGITAKMNGTPISCSTKNIAATYLCVGTPAQQQAIKAAADRAAAAAKAARDAAAAAAAKAAQDAAAAKAAQDAVAVAKAVADQAAKAAAAAVAATYAANTVEMKRRNDLIETQQALFDQNIAVTFQPTFSTVSVVLNMPAATWSNLPVTVTWSASLQASDGTGPTSSFGALPQQQSSFTAKFTGLAPSTTYSVTITYAYQSWTQESIASPAYKGLATGSLVSGTTNLQRVGRSTTLNPSQLITTVTTASKDINIAYQIPASVPSMLILVNGVASDTTISGTGSLTIPGLAPSTNYTLQFQE